MMFRVTATTLPLRVRGEDYTLGRGAVFTPDLVEATAKGELWMPLAEEEIEQHIPAHHIEATQ